MVINQWLPAAHRGDAIGDNARRYRDVLRAHGHDSHIYAMEADSEMRDEVRAFAAPAAREGDLTLFHFATPSPMTEAFPLLRGARVLQYHNITPAHFFAPFDLEISRLCLEARRQLRSLVGRIDLALGVSEFNRRELDNVGFANTGVLPLAVDLTRIENAPRSPALERSLSNGLDTFLFVGRVAPNKRIEHLIRLAACYKRCVSPHFRVIVVGRHDGVTGYYCALRALLAKLGWPSDRFVFTGPVPDADLAAYYRAARVYVSMSEHEGFCVPLVEAMAADLPVLAYSCTAVPDTLGGAGMQFAPKDFERVAVLLGLLASDTGLRTSIIEGQRRRRLHFQASRTDDDLRRLVGRFQ